MTTAERHAVGEAYGNRAAEAIGRRAAVTAMTVAKAEDRLRHAMRADTAVARRREQQREAEAEIRDGYSYSYSYQVRRSGIMTMIYSNPAREQEGGALPDVSVFYVGPHRLDTVTDSYGTPLQNDTWYWQRQHGDDCHFDGEPVGPFDTEAEAVADAQGGSGDSATHQVVDFGIGPLDMTARTPLDRFIAAYIECALWSSIEGADVNAMKSAHSLAHATGAEPCYHNMADVTACVICGRELPPVRNHVDSCSGKCFRAVIAAQRRQAFGVQAGKGQP